MKQGCGFRLWHAGDEGRERKCHVLCGFLVGLLSVLVAAGIRTTDNKSGTSLFETVLCGFLVGLLSVLVAAGIRTTDNKSGTSLFETVWVLIHKYSGTPLVQTPMELK